MGERGGGKRRAGGGGKRGNIQRQKNRIKKIAQTLRIPFAISPFGQLYQSLLVVFFLSCVANTQLNHWIEWVACTLDSRHGGSPTLARAECSRL